MKTPPRLACWLLRARLSKAHYECIAGDLSEEFYVEGKSRAWFWRQTLSTIRVGFGEIPEFQGGNPVTLFSDLWQDIHYSARTLRKSPGFAITAVLALAFGIGVNTGIFTILNAIALRPLPVEEANRVVSVYQTFRGKVNRNVDGSASYFSYPEYLNYRDNSHVFSGLAVFANGHASLGGADPRLIEGQVVSCNFFSVIGRVPMMGREFRPEECAQEGSAPVVILSHAFWSTQFHADPQILGSSILLNRRAFTVVGVAPADFPGIEATATNYWAPVTMQTTLIPVGNMIRETNWSWLQMLGRLKPGISASRAKADIAVIAGRIDQSYPGRTTTLLVDTATFVGEPQVHTAVLAGGTVALIAVGMVLLIACANVANLLLARAAARQKEIAIRLSTGASRGRLVRQLLTESLLISLTGGALGSVFAFWTFKAIFNLVMSNLPPDIPQLVLTIAPDWRVFGYAVAMSAVTGILFGLAPALQATRPDLVSALKEEGSGFAGSRLSRGWLRNALVVAQVSVCMVLLIAAGLLSRGLQAAQVIDPGFSYKGVITTAFDLQEQRYTDAQAQEFNRQVLERVAAIPGVDAVSEAVVTPLEGSSFGSMIEVEGYSGPNAIRYNKVSPAFFSLLSVPILRGRVHTEGEMKRDAHVAVVSDAGAKRFWPNQDALGKTFRMGKEKTVYEVIGVARDMRSADLAHLENNFFYFPANIEFQTHMHLLVHTNGNLTAAAKLIRDAAHTVDAGIIVTAKPLEESYKFWQTPSRILASVTAGLGLLGLLLASLGIYGVVSYAVSSRIREIGIRMTLGANPAGILSMVVKQAMRPVVLGLMIGLAACAAASRLMELMLYGVSPFDPVTFGGVAIFLMAVALMACYLPARRATRVDPMDALRYE